MVESVEFSYKLAWEKIEEEEKKMHSIVWYRVFLNKRVSEVRVK